MTGFLIAVGLVFMAFAFMIGYSAERRPITGLVFTIATAAILVPAGVLANGWFERGVAESRKAEIGDAAYARIAERKGRSCAVNALVAKAMRDGRITNAEYEQIASLAERERLKGAKSAVAGIGGATCRSENAET